MTNACSVCKNCDGYACNKLDVWIDDGTVEFRPGSYISILDYGNRYCKHFNGSVASNLILKIKRMINFHKK